MAWVVAITTIISVELMIRKSWWAWLTGLLNQGVWLTYIIVESQWGLLPLNMFMVFQNARGLRAWLRSPPK